MGQVKIVEAERGNGKGRSESEKRRVGEWLK